MFPPTRSTSIHRSARRAVRDRSGPVGPAAACVQASDDAGRRAIEKGETKGFIKVVADAETKRIVGAAILGVGGDEAIHGILDIMNAGASYPVLQWAVPIHPTVSN